MKGIFRNPLRYLGLMCSAFATSFLIILTFDNVRMNIWKIPQDDISLSLQSREAYALKSPMSQPASTLHPLRPIYPYYYKFIINQPEKCKGEAPFLVLLVVSTTRDLESRKIIRKTWGNESTIPGVVIKRLFMVGIDPQFAMPLQHALQEESQVFQDIIQQDFVDSYHNLTIKTMMGMEWVTKHCPNASYVLKIDTDVFLNIDFLVNDLLKPDVPARKNYFTGRILNNTGPVRSKAHWKWHIPKEIYPDDMYPPYCAGSSYVFSGDVAKKVYHVAQRIPSFPMEDTFVGLCLFESGIKITRPPNAVFHGYGMQFNPCKFYKLACVHPFDLNELLRLWPDFLPKNDTICHE